MERPGGAFRCAGAAARLGAGRLLVFPRLLKGRPRPLHRLLGGSARCKGRGIGVGEAAAHGARCPGCQGQRQDARLLIQKCLLGLLRRPFRFLGRGLGLQIACLSPALGFQGSVVVPAHLPKGAEIFAALR